MKTPSPGTERYWSEIEDADDQDDELVETRVGHWMQDDCDVYAGRGQAGSGHIANTEIGRRGWLGNPFTVDEYGRDEAVARYCSLLLERVDDDPDFRRALYDRVAGGTLGCWCRTVDDDDPVCHADVVADVADRIAEYVHGETVDRGDGIETDGGPTVLDYDTNDGGDRIILGAELEDVSVVIESPRRIDRDQLETILEEIPDSVATVDEILKWEDR